MKEAKAAGFDGIEFAVKPTSWRSYNTGPIRRLANRIRKGLAEKIGMVT